MSRVKTDDGGGDWLDRFADNITRRGAVGQRTGCRNRAAQTAAEIDGAKARQVAEADRRRTPTAAANANAKADAKAKAETRLADVANANAAYPVKGPFAASDAVVTMPNNRPTICTADEQNCVAITSRIHLDVGGYDYHPNTAATVPQKLDDGENLRRARIGVIGKFLGDWNYALIYDFGGTSDGFGGTGSTGAAPGVGGAPSASFRAARSPASKTPI